MQSIFYTEKTIAQCLSALNERMQAKGGGRALDGWVEKSGRFALSVTSKVGGRFPRTTILHGKLERQTGFTVVTTDVSTGASRRGQLIVFVALALVALALIASGNTLFAILLIPVGAAFYIPLTGDYHNSAVLLSEVQRTLKAKDKPPKKPAATPETKKTTAPARPVGSAPRPAPTRRAPPTPPKV